MKKRRDYHAAFLLEEGVGQEEACFGMEGIPDLERDIWNKM